MKITRRQLRQLIKEELTRVNEGSLSRQAVGLITTLTEWLQGTGRADRRAARGKFRPEYDLHRPFGQLSRPEQEAVLDALRGIEVARGSDWHKNNTIEVFEKIMGSGFSRGYRGFPTLEGNTPSEEEDGGNTTERVEEQTARLEKIAEHTGHEQ
jgi:5-formyltetrahydrofolate cyclo-ligase